jgi:hypothetical protein
MRKLIGIFFILALSMSAMGQEQVKIENFNFNKVANFIEKNGIITFEQGVPVDHLLRVNFEKKKYILILVRKDRHGYPDQTGRRGITGWYRCRSENHSFVLDKEGAYLMNHSSRAKKNVKKMLIFLNEQAKSY